VVQSVRGAPCFRGMAGASVLIHCKRENVMIRSSIRGLIILSGLSSITDVAHAGQPDGLGAGYGSYNSAFGEGALYNNTSGFSNTATGNGALYSNTAGCSSCKPRMNSSHDARRIRQRVTGLGGISVRHSR